MAICFESGQCCCCGLRSGVQIGVFIYFALYALGTYDSVNTLINLSNENDQEWLLHTDRTMNCKDNLCKGASDDSDCFSIKIDAGDKNGSPVKEMHVLKRMEIGFWGKEGEEEGTKYDYTKWKLLTVEDWHTTRQLWPVGDQRNEASLQKALTSMAEDKCEGNNVYTTRNGRKLVFDWTGDPVQKEMESTHLSFTFQWKLRTAIGMILQIGWISVTTYLGWVVFGGIEEIVGKKAHSNRARTFMISLLILDVLAHGWNLYIQWNAFFVQIVLAYMAVTLMLKLMFFVFVDNLNDVVQQGGTGAEGLSASELVGKIPNELTPLASAAASPVVGDPIQAEDAAAKQEV